MIFRGTAGNYPRSFREKEMTSKNESRLSRRLEERASIVNCTLDFKYFDVPEILPHVPASTSCVNIYDYLSLSLSLSLGVQIFPRCCCALHGVSILFFVLK